MNFSWTPKSFATISHSWAPDLHHWLATSAVINRATFVHEWSKVPELFRICQLCSWGQPLRYIVMECNLSSVRNPNFWEGWYGITLMFPIISWFWWFGAMLCFVFYYDWFEVIQGSLTFSQPSTPLYVENLAFFAIHELLLLFLGRVNFALFYIVLSKKCIIWYFLLECKLSSVNIIMTLKIITKTTPKYVQPCL